MQDIDKLGGIVEVDETFVGGLAKNRHWDKRGGGGGTGGIGSGKTPIVGAVSRKGNVVARVVANVNSATLRLRSRSGFAQSQLALHRSIAGYNPSIWTFRTRPLTMREANMSSAQSTLKPSKASGRSSSAA